MKKRLQLVLAAMLSLLISQGQAATITVQVTGTFAAGSLDVMGLFGSPLANLDGVNFTATETVDSSFLNSVSAPPTYASNFQFGTVIYGSPPVVNETILTPNHYVLGENTHSTTLDLSSGGLYLALARGAGSGSGFYDVISGGFQENRGALSIENVWAVYSETRKFISPSMDFSQNLIFTVGSDMTGVGGIKVSSSGQPIETLAYTVESVVLNPVPEPETNAMLLVGLGILGCLARRRSSATA